MPATVTFLGLECFESSGPPLFDGSKDLSVRDFPLPDYCAGQPIFLLATADPPAGKPLPDELGPGAGGFHIAGVVNFSSSAEPYASRAAFEADAARHHMPPGSALYSKYAGEPGAPWPGPLGDIYPWHITAAWQSPKALAIAPTPALKRRQGPLFEVHLPRELAIWATASQARPGAKQAAQEGASAVAPDVADAPHTAKLRANLSRKKQVSATSVPTLDFSAYYSADAGARADLGARMFASMKDIGFVILVNHGLPAPLTQRAFAESANFFALPYEAKARCAFLSPEANRGFLGIKEEKADFRVPDLRETINIGDEYDGFPNPWPAELPAFRETMLELYDRSNELHLDVLRCLAIGMGLDKDHFTPLCDGRCNTLRLLHYPACKRTQLSDDLGGQKRAGAHTDYGTITLLHQSGGGLYVCDANGEWVFVPPIDGSIIVNVGDIMMRWSNDVLRSTPHCVMDDPRVTGDETPARYSMAYFCNPNRDALIECLPTCSSDARPPLYPPVTAGDYIVERVAALVKFDK
jgi:isopenicillin N synthase-like dioxygenase